MKVLVLGSTGMLGLTVSKYLESQGHDVTRTSRTTGISKSVKEIIKFDVLTDSVARLNIVESNYDYVINCIGLIKNLIDNSVHSRELATKINVEFPIELGKIIANSGVKVIQIGTDCVYSGKDGNYAEDSLLDPVDIYGYSKALGEFSSKNQMLLRCSIVGRELKNHTSLMDWVLTQPKNAEIDGFVNHLWNGITTLTFAKLVNGIITQNLFEGNTFHVVPQSELSKYELVSIFTEAFNRSDIQVNRIRADIDVNRTLTTLHQDKIGAFWVSAGYQTPPTHLEMILEYAEYLSENSENEGEN